MPIGAFIVFLGSFIIFVYLLIVDYNKTQGERPVEDSIWIGVFFTILVICLIVSGICIAKSSKFVKRRRKKLVQS
jgi:quinol-cytochrome oxidoreductase complex cytochrome b subunit